MFPNMSASPFASLFENPPTGEPDAGDPLVRFGGRGSRNGSPYPYQTDTLPNFVLQIAGDLLHPALVRVGRATCKMNATRRPASGHRFVRWPLSPGTQSSGPGESAPRARGGSRSHHRRRPVPRASRRRLALLLPSSCLDRCGWTSPARRVVNQYLRPFLRSRCGPRKRTRLTTASAEVWSCCRQENSIAVAPSARSSFFTTRHTSNP